MLASMQSREFTEWMAYFKLEPFGEERADLRAGIIASATVNMQMDPQKSTPTKPQDFMPKFEPDPLPSKEDIAASWDTYLSALAKATEGRA